MVVGPHDIPIAAEEFVGIFNNGHGDLVVSEAVERTELIPGSARTSIGIAPHGCRVGSRVLLLVTSFNLTPKDAIQSAMM